MAGTGAAVGGTVGAVAGSYFGPVGTVAGGALGGAVGGLFDESDVGPYKSPSFSDIDLAKENPELYAELMKVSAAADEAQALYDQRNRGMSNLEAQQYASAKSNSEARLANQGLLGTSAGSSAQAGVEQQVLAQIAARAVQEQQALAQNNQAAHSALFQDYMAAQNQVVNPMQNAAYANWQNANQIHQGNNQFYGGLINGGMALAGNAYNMNQMQGMQDNKLAGQMQDMNGLQLANVSHYNVPQGGYTNPGFSYTGGDYPYQPGPPMMYGGQ